MIKKFIIIVVFLSFGVLSCNVHQVKKEFADLDRTYISTIHYLKEGNAQQARAGLLVIQEKWQKIQYQGTQAKINQQDHYKMSSASRLIQHATTNLVEGQFDQVENQLMEAKKEWSDWRVCNGMEYYLDHLFAFETAWGQVLNHLEEPTMCQLDWTAFYKDIELASQAWDRVFLENIDWEIIRVGMDKREQIEVFKTKIQAGLQFFYQESNWAHLESTICQSKLIAADFNQMLLSFGLPVISA